MRRLRTRARQTWLTLHIISSVGWLGAEAAALALCLTGMAATGSAKRAAFISADVLADTLLVPASLLALVTGVVLGLGTKWGLVTYYWAFAKLLAGALLVVASAFALDSSLAQAAATPPTGGEQASLAGMMTVIASLGVFASVISVTKPWGRMRREPATPRARTTQPQEAS
jgi:hypothetical protein